MRFDDALSPGFPLGDSLEVCIRREEAEHFIEEERGDNPEHASYVPIEERAQKHQNSESELQPSPVPEDLLRKPTCRLRRTAQSNGDDRRNAPRRENVPAAARLFRRAPRLGGGVVHGAS